MNDGNLMHLRRKWLWSQRKWPWLDKIPVKGHFPLPLQLKRLEWRDMEGQTLLSSTSRGSQGLTVSW